MSELDTFIPSSWNRLENYFAGMGDTITARKETCNRKRIVSPQFSLILLPLSLMRWKITTIE